MAQNDFPSNIVIASSIFSLRRNELANRSPFSRAGKIRQFDGTHWVATLTTNIESYLKDEIRDFQAFIYGLSEDAGQFNLWDHRKSIPRGNPGGNPIVSGDNQLGYQLLTTGWSPSTTVLRKDDVAGVDTPLGPMILSMTADILSDAGGTATLKFVPKLRGSPVNTAVIRFDKPMANFRLRADPQPQKVNSVVSYVIDAEEFFPS